MPYKSEKIKIEGTDHDRRKKLSDADREAIREEYATGTTSQRKLAAKYGVSRRLITFVLDPKKKERDLECREQRGGSKHYYDREKNREYMKEHRRYKQKLYKQGEINLDKSVDDE